MSRPAGGRYHIYSPGLSQAVAVAQLLRREKDGVHLTGVLLPGESVGAAGAVYDEVLREADLRPDLGAIEVGTGAGSTRHLADRGDLTLGEVTLTKESLRFYDKIWSLALAAAANVPAPRTWRAVDDVEVWPCFYKSAEEAEDRRRGLARNAAEIPTDSAGLIFQEVIESRGTYGVGFIARDGEIVASHTHFEAESMPRLGGSAVIIERHEDARLQRHARALVRASNYSGWGLAEFKYCARRDDFAFMEINTKLWASWEMALRNEPAFARDLFGIAVKPEGIQRMLFLDLALRRGPSFWPQLFRALASRAVVKAYPGWARQAAAGLIPRYLFPAIKRLIR